MGEFKVEVTAKTFSNGDICLERRTPSTDPRLADTLHRRIIQTEGQAVREALISLGWTPPPEPHQGRGGGE